MYNMASSTPYTMTQVRACAQASQWKMMSDLKNVSEWSAGSGMNSACVKTSLMKIG